MSTTLKKISVDSGVRYEGAGYVFIGKGESVSLSEGGQTLNCYPVTNPEKAPFNFGD